MKLPFARMASFGLENRTRHPLPVEMFYLYLKSGYRISVTPPAYTASAPSVSFTFNKYA